MKDDVKKSWIEALQSGNYKHVGHRLRSGDCFCAMGVLCELHSKATGKKWGLSGNDRMDSKHAETIQIGKIVKKGNKEEKIPKKIKPIEDEWATTFYLGQYMAAPDEVLEWAGLSPSDQSLVIIANNEFEEDHRRTYKAVVKMIEEKF